MARTSIKPISIPEGVDIQQNDEILSFEGKAGSISLLLNKLTFLKLEKENMSFEPVNDSKEALAITGTMRALSLNNIVGVTQGFERKLEINGVGYRANLQWKTLELSLGFSHPVKYEIPEIVQVELPSQTEITLKSIDKQVLGQVAAEIRSIRPPEPYKGKGVKYADEHIRRKESKKS